MKTIIKKKQDLQVSNFLFVLILSDKEIDMKDFFFKGRGDVIEKLECQCVVDPTVNGQTKRPPHFDTLQTELLKRHNKSEEEEKAK